MRNIVSGILSLIQHNQTLETNFEKFRPTKCPHCGKSGLWHHGRYDRKADHENSGSASLNPVTIPRSIAPIASILAQYYLNASRHDGIICGWIRRPLYVC